MEPTTVSQHARLSSIALALVLLVFLGMLAVRVHAEEMTPPIQEQARQLKQERTSISEENTLERRALFDENKEQRMQWRASSSEALRTALENRRDDLKARVEARRAEVESQREAVRARLAESAQERLGAFASRMTERMNSILDHLQDIAERITSRIEKIEDVVGTELTEARGALDEATKLIGDARKDVTYLGSLTAETLTSDDPKERMEEVREASKIAKDSIVEVHRALRDAIVLIKDSVSAGAEDDGESNTTEE